jgi:nucleotide-binding universal stress UspA family protein
MIIKGASQALQYICHINTCFMKKILVPCDFSKPAINAYRFALDIAAKSKGTVQLIYVIELPVLHDTMLMPVLNFEDQLLKDLKERTTSQFKKLTDKYNSEGVKVTWRVEFGVPSRTILDYVSAAGIDLIIMGSHGANGLREYFIGSNAEKIIRRSPVPVLIIKNYIKGEVKNIVFPNTLQTEDQEDLVLKIKALQSYFKARLHIVWINTPITFTSDVITLQRLSAFAKRFAFKDYTVNIFNHPNEEEGIIQFTKVVKGDMIAMGTHGRNGLTHLINGSIAEDVANHADNLIWTYTLKNEPVEAN